jgi:hypothetical protein
MLDLEHPRRQGIGIVIGMDRHAGLRDHRTRIQLRHTDAPDWLSRAAITRA